MKTLKFRSQLADLILVCKASPCEAITMSDVLKTERIFSVSEYLECLNIILHPQRALVQGEVGEVDQRAGYTFFTLLDKDEKAVLRCFIWQRVLNGLGVELKEGVELQVEGFPSIFKRTGGFSFEVGHIGLVGEGALKLAFEKLKKKLEGLGYFAEERKKPIPPYIQNIGLITSGFGDAKNDFLTHLGQFGFRISFYDVRVEGLYAIDDITNAIRWFNENTSDIEVLVLTRGGGSLESLQAFNSEAVSKAIFGSKIPIITGIGHENDETIADLVADLYASTPTHAARVLSDPWRQAEILVDNSQEKITSSFTTRCKNFRLQVTDYEQNILLAPQKILSLKKQELTGLRTLLESQFQKVIFAVKQTQLIFWRNWEKLKSHFLATKNEVGLREKAITNEAFRWLKFLTNNLLENEQRLLLVGPEARLKQGYSFVFDLCGKIVKSSQQIKVGETLNLKFSQGGADSKVEKVHP